MATPGHASVPSSKPTIGILLASTRQGRKGEPVARWVERLARLRQGWEVEFIDIAEWVFPPYRHPDSPMVADRSYADEKERAWVELISRLDGYIFVTPEYNHGYPAGLKNAIDHVYNGWNRKPAAFVSYGGPAGGVRSVQQLRQVVIELQMAPVRDEVNIPFIGRALDERGEPKEEFQTKRLNRLFDSLEWWTRTLKTGRSRTD